MTAEQALACVWREAKRSSQELVAKAIGVSGGTLTGWKNGVTPKGKSLAALLAWAEALPVPAPIDVLVDAQRETAQNIVRLSELLGYAKFVRDSLYELAKRQDGVVDGMVPWVQREEDAETAKLRAKLDAVSPEVVTKPAAAAKKRRPA